MINNIFHIFNNTPMGREILLQTIYFCNIVDVIPAIYVPKFSKYLMYFENDVVQVELDNSYLTSNSTAHEHIVEIVEYHKCLKPKYYTSSMLPDIPTDFAYMCCPRTLSHFASINATGHIGSSIRHIIKVATFPVLLASPIYKQWHNIAVCFDGSRLSVNALKLGLHLHKRVKMPIKIFTQVEYHHHHEHRISIDNFGESDQEIISNNWIKFDKGKFVENLYKVPHDALIVAGAYGHSFIRDILFGSKLEKIQSTLPNNILIAGPKYQSENY